MNSLSVLRSLRVTALPATRIRSIATAALIGRVTSPPTKRETSDGRVYYTYYPLAVHQPSKKDADGNVLRGESGYPVHDTDWYTIFNFSERAYESLENLRAGSTVYVEAKITLSTSDIDGKPVYHTNFHEKRRQILQYTKQAASD